MSDLIKQVNEAFAFIERMDEMNLAHKDFVDGLLVERKVLQLKCEHLQEENQRLERERDHAVNLVHQFRQGF